MNIKTIFIPLALFVVSTLLLWMPFDTYDAVYSTGLKQNKPAGQITKGFRLTQTITPPKLAGDSATTPSCFSLRFATYMRRNSGTLLLTWQQGSTSQSWIVEAAELKDNTYVDFCPHAGISMLKPFQLTIAGIDGVKGRSATVWLTTASPGRAQITGRDDLKMGLAFKLSNKRSLHASEILHLNHGAFAFGWFCTLLTGIIAWLFATRSTEPNHSR